jgi:hypothetical protein
VYDEDYELNPTAKERLINPIKKKKGKKSTKEEGHAYA